MNSSPLRGPSNTNSQFSGHRTEKRRLDHASGERSRNSISEDLKAGRRDSGGDGARVLQEERELLAHAVHELRSPLAILQGVHYLLDRDHAANAKREGRPVDARSRRHMELLGEAVQSLKDQVDRLLDLHAVARGAQDAAPAPLATVLRETAERFNHAQEHGPRVRWGVDPTTCGETLVDGGRLGIALHNLIGNALKYSPPSATVDITARALGRGHVRLEIRDRGRGVPAADRERLGEPYFRASNAAGTPGTGLGLRVVRRAVETMGGSFGYAPPPADEPGAIFWLEFPGLDGDPQAPASAPAAVSRRAGGRSGKGRASTRPTTSTRKRGRSA